MPGISLHAALPARARRLLLHVAAEPARERRARGLRLNYPEAVALLTSFAARGRPGRADRRRADGRRPRRAHPRRRHGRASRRCSDEVQVEATFPDGTKLVTVHEPISDRHGERTSDPGAGPPRAPARSAQRRARAGTALTVSTPATGRSRSARTSTSPRPTPRWRSTATAAAGMRLAIPAGTAVRFEPGVAPRRRLVALAGRRTVAGLRGVAGGREGGVARCAELVPRALRRAVRPHRRATGSGWPTPTC